MADIEYFDAISPSQQVTLDYTSGGRTIEDLTRYLDVKPELCKDIRLLRIQAAQKMRVYASDPSYEDNMTLKEPKLTRSEKAFVEKFRLEMDAPKEGTNQDTECTEEDIEEAEEAASSEQSDSDEESNHDEESYSSEEFDTGEEGIDSVDSNNNVLESWRIPQKEIDLQALSVLASKLVSLETVTMEGVFWSFESPHSLDTSQLRSCPSVGLRLLAIHNFEQGIVARDFLQIFHVFPQVKTFYLFDISWAADSPYGEDVEGDLGTSGHPTSAISRDDLNSPPQLPAKWQVETIILDGTSLTTEGISEDFPTSYLNTVHTITNTTPAYTKYTKNLVDRTKDHIVDLTLFVDSCSTFWSEVDFSHCTALRLLSLEQDYRSRKGDYGKDAILILDNSPLSVRRIKFVFRMKGIRAELMTWDWQGLRDALHRFGELERVEFTRYGSELDSDKLKFLPAKLKDTTQEIIGRELRDIAEKGLLHFLP